MCEPTSPFLKPTESGKLFCVSPGKSPEFVGAVISMDTGVSETSPERRVGYAGVSAIEQELELQLDTLRDAGVSEKLLFTDKKTVLRRSDRDSMKIDSAYLFFATRSESQATGVIAWNNKR